MQKLGKFCLEKMPTHGTFDVEISLAKGIIKIGLANGAILKLWAAHPCPKFSREPPALGKFYHFSPFPLVPAFSLMGHKNDKEAVVYSIEPR